MTLTEIDTLRLDLGMNSTSAATDGAEALIGGLMGMGLISLLFVLFIWLLYVVFFGLGVACCVKYLFFSKPKVQEITVKAESLEQVIRKQVADELVRRGH